MSEKLCLYHRSDLDGQCSGAIYHRAHPDGELFGIDYGDNIPWDKIADADLTVIDWSFQPWENFVLAATGAASITWIDHHKSAIATWEAETLPPGCCPVTAVLDTRYAGCELAWSHFFPDVVAPFGVWMLGRYDVWDHEDPRVLPYQYGMRVLDTAPRNAVWSKVLTTWYSNPWHQQRIDIGSSILTYQRQVDAAAVKDGCFPVHFDGLEWQAYNRLGKGPTFFDSIWDPSKFHGMLAFGWNGREWVVGLYSTRDTVDCGAIAKAHGGGGHKGAAGFHCKSLPFAIGIGGKPDER